ncbi:MAG: hypothetical protein FD145_1322 [Candidatus Saganbacteria bacterium]|uniref:Uncharacterized protein n=1 Tax=Candidatus Saganbacteria bacterium TaxID=2575572 RepID=A0A833L028_UNCSA|nr:MAG: hypothetical protein FD145_1322 [Candidatus Saganbacteria bacterium]
MADPCDLIYSIGLFDYLPDKNLLQKAAEEIIYKEKTCLEWAKSN